MTTFTWGLDAPSGVFKNHALSEKLYQAAVAESKFMDHVVPVDGYGRKMGESVTLKNLAAGVWHPIAVIKVTTLANSAADCFSGY